MTIQNGLDNRNYYNFAGAQNILFLAFENLLRIRGNNEDLVEQLDIIPGEKYHLFHDTDDISYLNTASLSKNGLLYDIQLSFTVTIQTIQKNRLMNQLADTDLVALVQDLNNRWWLLGHEQPLKMTLIEQKIDNDNNIYTVKLSTKQREPVKVMSDAWIGSIPQLPISVLIDSIDGAGLMLNITVPDANGGQEPQTNVGNTITLPPDGYHIPANMENIFALHGTTIYLPLSAVDGQTHLIKDYTGLAENFPITINAQGRKIEDDYSDFILDSGFGAVQMKYTTNKWMTTAWVD